MAIGIEVDGIEKTFFVAEKETGVLGAIRGLFNRRYRRLKALDSLSFSIQSGEMIGFIGPNGAGKSTTIKILSGILLPDKGKCEVLGITPWENRISHVSRIGVVFGQRTQLWWDLPVIESFELLRDIYRVPNERYRQNLDELSQMLDLTSIFNIPVRQLSLGQRMRCDLTAALLHSPSILFLDEPTIGLDAPSKLAVRGFLSRLNKTLGTTIIITTHDLDDIESLCKRVLVINSGRLLFDGCLEDLRKSFFRERRLKIDFDECNSDFHVLDLKIVSREGNRIIFSFDPESISAPVLIQKIAEKHNIRDIFVENPPIEEVISRLYHDSNK
ncbi:ATP-binding cassette domain-containing protein [bacterium]|nr:ATP-binding cassette domain-containing protein [bacterium]